jgi:MFS family permease
MPLVMFSIGLFVHAKQLTGSFAAAGAVSAAYACAVGLGGPLLGRLVDRRGQTRVLLGSATASALLLAGIALVPAGVRVEGLVAMAAGIGLATPPTGACLRTLLPELLPDAAALGRAYNVDAFASELCWVFGPPIVLALGAVTSTGMALAVSGLILLAATAAFAAHPASRAWTPAAHTASQPRTGALRAPAMRTLVLVFTLVGILFGAAEVAVTAAGTTLGGAGAAAPMLALWGAGSLVGGLVAPRLGRRATLVSMLTVLAIGHLLLAAAAGAIVTLAAALVLAGIAIAPTYAIVYAMVGKAAPAGTSTEAFAWLATAIALGGGLGAAVGGSVIEHSGPAAAFALAGVAGILAVVTATVRAVSPVHELHATHAVG